MMIPWILPALLSTALAGPPDDAATVLSRYPAGRVPNSPVVMDAIRALQEEGGADHIGVLQSLQEHEQSPIREAAGGALLIVTLRARLERREAYTAPDNRDVRRWLSEHQPARDDGSPLGEREADAVAYAVLVCGGPQKVYAQTPTVLISEGEKREDEADLHSALLHYSFAAARGDHAAREIIGAFGLDTERLLLGLSARTRLLTEPPAETLDTLIGTGSAQTVAVLIERSRASDEITQVQALDALAEMIRRGQLPAAARRQARQRLEDATHDNREPMRVFALTVLSDLE